MTQLPGSPGPSNAQGIATGLAVYEEMQRQEAQEARDAEQAERDEAAFQQTMKLRGMQVQEQEMRMGQAQRRQAANEQFYADIVTGEDRSYDAQVRSIGTPTEVAILDRMIAARDDPTEYARMQQEILASGQSREAQSLLGDYRLAGQIAADDGVVDLEALYAENPAFDPSSEEFNIDRANARLREILGSHATKQQLVYDREVSNDFIVKLRGGAEGQDAKPILGELPDEQAANRERANAIISELQFSTNLADHDRDRLHGELSTLYNKSARAHAQAVEESVRMRARQAMVQAQGEAVLREGAEAAELLKGEAARSSSMTATEAGKRAGEDPGFRDHLQGAILSSARHVKDTYPDLWANDMGESAGDLFAESITPAAIDIFRLKVAHRTGVVLSASEAKTAIEEASVEIERGPSESGAARVLAGLPLAVQKSIGADVLRMGDSMDAFRKGMKAHGAHLKGLTPADFGLDDSK